MATPRRTRAHRGGSKRTSGSGALIDTVRSTITKIGGNRGRPSRGGSRGRSSRGGGGGAGGLASQATGFIGGLLSGGDSKRGSSRGRSRGRRRR